MEHVVKLDHRIFVLDRVRSFRACFLRAIAASVGSKIGQLVGQEPTKDYRLRAFALSGVVARGGAEPTFRFGVEPVDPYWMLLSIARELRCCRTETLISAGQLPPHRTAI